MWPQAALSWLYPPTALLKQNKNTWISILYFRKDFNVPTANILQNAEAKEYWT